MLSTRTLFFCLFSGLLLSACGDSPTGPSNNTGTTGSAFNIEVRYLGTPTAAQRGAVESAIARWRSVITGELENVPMNVPAGRCFADQPLINETVDDMLIYVEFMAIDGVGKVLGQAGPCYVRNSNSLPIFGYLQLDVADAAKVESQGLLDDLVLHEIGHVLGFGTMWRDATLVSDVGGTDPTYTGAAASVAYRLLNPAATGVPVENTGTSGTRDSHWRESVLGIELMTGYLNVGSNPMSRVTIASMQDLGYTVNAARADSYSLAGGVVAGARIELHGGAEELVLPRYRVDALGIIR
jgi:hypothetical protein